MTFCITLAGFTFELTCTYPDTQQMCANYLAKPNATVDHAISVTPAGIAAEQDKSIREALCEGLTPVAYTPGYLETLAVYRQIADYISHHNGAVFHGALIERQGVGYLFTAKSGTGKTTHILNWQRHFPDTRIINGDKPIIRIMPQGVFAFGTPWCGKEGWNTNDAVRLGALVVLERGQADALTPLPFSDATALLLGQTYRPADPTGSSRALRFVAQLKDKVGIYRLQCTMDENSAQVAYDGMAAARDATTAAIAPATGTAAAPAPTPAAAEVRP